MMIATQFGPISLANHCVCRRGCPVLASDRLGQRRGSFLASEVLGSSLPEVDPPLQVEPGGHHRHRKVCPRRTGGAQQLAAHRLDGGKSMLDPRLHLGDTSVTPLLALGQGLVTFTLSLERIPEAFFLHPGFSLRRRIAPVGTDAPVGVVRVEHGVEVPLRTHRARSHPIPLCLQHGKVDVRRDLGQRMIPHGIVLQAIVLLAAKIVSEQVGLDGMSRFHRSRLRMDQSDVILSRMGEAEVFRNVFAHNRSKFRR